MSSASNHVTQPEETLTPTTTSPPTPAIVSAPTHLTFPDGDIVLKSSDGKEFRVHSVILREASTVFRDMLKLPEGASRDQTPISLVEKSQVLDDLMRWLYPLPTAPTITNITHALELFRAVEKFQIESHAIDSALTGYINKQSNPLRAWALAARFGLVEARKSAARRILMTNDDLLDECPTEMDIIDAKSYMKLLRVKRDTIIWARSIITTNLLDCESCTRLPHAGISYQHARETTWHSKYREKISTGNPFETSVTSDLMAEMHVSAHGQGCCRDRFKPGGAHARMMHEIRVNLQEVLKKAVHSECHGTKFM